MCRLPFVDEDKEEEKAELEALETKYKPLIEYLKEFAKDSVKDGRLLSPFSNLVLPSADL